MKKELEFLTKIDNSEFDKSIDNMKKKLSEVNNALSSRQTSQRMESMGIGTNTSQTTLSAFQKSINQTKKDMDQLIAAEAKNQEKLGKEIASRTMALSKMVKEQEKMSKGSKEELDNLVKVKQIRESINTQHEQFRQRDQMMNQTMNARQNMDKALPAMNVPAGAPRGGPPIGSPGPSSPNYVDMTKSGVKGIGSFLGAVGAIGLAASRFTGYGQRLEEARGSAIQGTAGQDLERTYAGKSSFDQMFLQERQSAEGLAAQKESRNRITDRMMGLGSVGSIIGGVGVGAASLMGIPFTAGGSALGLGTAGAMIGTGIAGLSNDRNRQGIFGGQEYEQLVGAERTKDFRTNLENITNQDPQKMINMRRYEQNYQRDVATQRTLGMSDEDLYGNLGFIKRGHGAGFMEDQMNQMGQNIVGAGGSARMGQQAEFGLQMERSGLTNAGGILGSLSGGLQSPESTKRATISIMSEAFKIGLDSTDFAEENRRFTQAAATIISQSGTNNEADQERLTRMLSSFVGERTNKGIEAAQGAYEQFQQRSSDLGGRRGAIRTSMAQNDPLLGKLDPLERTELLAARPDQLDDPAFMAYYMQKTGAENPDQIRAALGKGVKASRFMNPTVAKRFEESQNKINAYLKDRKLTYPQFLEKIHEGTLGETQEDKDIQAEFGRAEVLENSTRGEGFNRRASESRLGEGIQGYEPQTADEKLRAQASLEKMDRTGDQITAAGAKGEEESRRALNEMLPAISKVTSGFLSIADAAVSAASGLNKVAPGNNAALPQASGLNTDVMKRFVPEDNMSVQPQAGKSSR